MRTRSILSVPGANSRMIDKALASDADIVMLDLEDATAPDQKAAARETIVEAVRDGDWRGRPKTFRCNGLDTHWMYRDIVEVMQGTGCGVDRLVLPKVSDAGYVRAVSILLRQLEQEYGRAKPVRLDVQIETAKGIVNCDAIASSDSRISALTFGPGDFAASAGYPLAGIGLSDQWDEAYGGDRWHYPMSRISIAAHAAGVDAIDGPYAAFRDLEVCGHRRCERERSASPENGVFIPRRFRSSTMFSRRVRTRSSMRAGSCLPTTRRRTPESERSPLGRK